MQQCCPLITLVVLPTDYTICRPSDAGLHKEIGHYLRMTSKFKATAVSIILNLRQQRQTSSSITHAKTKTLVGVGQPMVRSGTVFRCFLSVSFHPFLWRCLLLCADRWSLCALCFKESHHRWSAVLGMPVAERVTLFCQFWGQDNHNSNSATAVFDNAPVTVYSTARMQVNMTLKNVHFWFFMLPLDQNFILCT